MIGEYIIMRRKELGIKRKELAERLDITYNYLNLIETNKRKISKKLINKMAKELKVKVEELEFYNSTNNVNTYKAEINLIKKQISYIVKQITKIDNDKILLEKERDFLCEKLVVLELNEKKMKGEDI